MGGATPRLVAQRQRLQRRAAPLTGCETRLPAVQTDQPMPMVLHDCDRVGISWQAADAGASSGVYYHIDASITVVSLVGDTCAEAQFEGFQNWIAVEQCTNFAF